MSIINRFPSGGGIETVTVQLLGNVSHIMYINKDCQVSRNWDADYKIMPIKNSLFYVEYGSNPTGGVTSAYGTNNFIAGGDGTVTSYATSG